MSERTDSTVEILLVDDRQDGLIALEAVLSGQENYRLVKANSGHEALRQMPFHDFAVILLDVQMPGLDGFQTAELIRRQSRFQSVPIIFVTAINKDERYVYRGFEVGAVDYIFKPFDPMILRSKVAVFADLHLKNRKIREQAMQLAEREILAQRAQFQTIELENLRRYKSLGDAIPHIVLRALGPDKLEMHNALWTEYTGMRTSDSIGTGWHKAIDIRDLPGLVMTWQNHMDAFEPFETEVRIRHVDGAYHWHWFKAVPELDKGDHVIAWLATCTDINDRKLSEEQLKEARKNAEAANEAKTHFLANMSHEIRTPLNAIMGFSEFLLDPHLNEEEKRNSASVIRRNGNQLLKIVDEILDISKVEAGGLQIEQVEFSLADLMTEIKTSMQAQATRKQLELRYEVAPNLPERIVSDSTRLRQILLNVIGNAIKFTEQGSVSVLVEMRTGDTYPCLHVLVTDTGLGVAPHASEKIFDAFSQADSSTTRLYGGTGLGLALSRRLARALGGDVRLVSSELGIGSQFEIEVRVSFPKHKDSEGDEEEAGLYALPPGTPALRGKRILLVEDAEDNQSLITRYLDPAGVTVDIASNGVEGVRKALDGDYEAVLMDIQMPLLDGYQATARLRQAGYKRPIIALTAYALSEERDKSLRQGCNAHLTKPINRRRLLESLAKIVAD